MSTLDRYILNIFIRNLLLVLATLIALYSLIEFLERVDDFIEHQAAWGYYITYPLLKLPVMIANSLPMATLLATFATIGGLSRSSQLTAMLSSGISFIRISRPLFLGGLVLSILVIIGNLWLVPLSSRETSYIRSTAITGTQQKASGKDIYFRDGNSIVSIKKAFPAKNLILGLTVVDFDENFIPIKRIQAEKAVYKNNGEWQLGNAVVWDFVPETKSIGAYKEYEVLSHNLKRQPSEMLQLWDRPEDLTVGELLQLSAKLQNEGFDSKAYQVEAQMRFAKAAIPLIMVLVGIPFALQRGRNASFSLGIVISLAIFIIYFILYAVFAVFGATAILPPLVAAWAANILMTLIGSWLFLRLDS
jgi:lipopolysaccharide export system permease protein